MSNIDYPRRNRRICIAWKYLFKLPGGHKYFRDSRGFIAVADASGSTPDVTEFGCLYVRTDLPIRMGQSAAIDVIDTEGSSYVILESAENGLDLANRLKMAVNAHGKTYRLVEVAPEITPGSKLSCLTACKHMLKSMRCLIEDGGGHYDQAAAELDAELLAHAIANEEAQPQL